MLVSESRGVRQEPNRLANLDLLRSLCMLAVVAVHCSASLGIIGKVDGSVISSKILILCDPIFFALSGYFAIRPLRSNLLTYYLHKIGTIVLPLFVYAIILYFYTNDVRDYSLSGWIAYFHSELGPWWFIPTLIPFLAIAPFLYWAFEKLSDSEALMIIKAFSFVTLWGIISNFLCWLFRITQHPTLELTITILKSLLPTVLIPGRATLCIFVLDTFFVVSHKNV